MDTVRVDICYRPLRVGWAIHSGDIDAFRSAVRLSYALWGGRFNPILMADREADARQLADLFRVDLILPIGDSDQVQAFPKLYPYLIKPFFHATVFVGGSKERKRAQLLDVHNAFVHFLDRPEWKAVKERGVRLYSWQADDPLGDVFLVQFGKYPNREDSGADYRALLVQATEATEHTIGSTGVIPGDTLDHPSIPYVSRHSVSRHYSVDARRDIPGFFVGDSRNVDDLVCHWNLRAADIPLLFVDTNHFAQYAELLPAWEKTTRRSVARRHEWDRQIGVWSRRDDIDEVARVFGDMRLMRCHVSEMTSNGLNVRVPMMYLDEVSVVGVIGRERGTPKVSFALSEKPFCGDVWFHQQHLVASISLIGGLYGDERHTLVPPYVPELNEFYARRMHLLYNKLRVERGRMGLVIDAADHDTFINALPVADLMERVFHMAGFRAKLSQGGLILRQLIALLGDVQGARVFKIPGVRRLLRTYGPAEAFTMKGAVDLIGSKDPGNPKGTFSDHEDLYIEQRPPGTKLSPPAVFAFLVEKGLFRIGRQLTCPSCRMESWTGLDALKQRVVCELCGHEHDASRQLVSSVWNYRRSGVMGAERNAQGAVPVALTLQQLEASLDGGLHESVYSPSLSLEPEKDVDLPKCEVDFVWLIPRPYRRRTAVILGECKDLGPIKPEEFKKDVENLRRVAAALPENRFKAFILFSKLTSFTPEEIEMARSLNDKYRQRVILLTSRELEPYFIYERTKTEVGIDGYASSPEDLAAVTAKIYFAEQLST